MNNFDAFSANYYNQIKQALYGVVRYYSERSQNLRQIESEANVRPLSSLLLPLSSSRSFLRSLLSLPLCADEHTEFNSYIR